MTTLVVCSSQSSHRNTWRVASALGSALDAQVVSVEEATSALLNQADRIGFGSGIYWMSFDPRLMDFIRALPDMSGRDAFVFASSGLPEPPFRRYTRELRKLLEQRGFSVVGTFTCRGEDTWGPFGWIGGVSRGRPDDNDLAGAGQFAARLG